jgi:hypothetical protein
MLSFLESILHGILDLPYLLVNLLITSLNGWLALLGTLAAAALALLPGFPSAPTISSEIAAIVAWLIPVPEIAAIFATFLAAWLVWLIAAPAIRWAKGIGS